MSRGCPAAVGEYVNRTRTTRAMQRRPRVAAAAAAAARWDLPRARLALRRRPDDAHGVSTGKPIAQLAGLISPYRKSPSGAALTETWIIRPSALISNPVRS